MDTHEGLKQIDMRDYNQYWKQHKKDECINLPHRGIKSRLDLFKKNLTNKNVLHIGCSDSPLTKDKILQKQLLHQYLENFTKSLTGIDSDEKGVKIMLEGSIRNIFVGDIYALRDDKNLLSKKFDVILISEVIEHLTNPGLALESVKEYILKTNPLCEVIFTVPNIHNFYINFLSGLKSKECVHFDHKCYYSYRTFRTLIEEYNFEVDDFYYVIYEKYPVSIKGKTLLKLVSKISPCLGTYFYFRRHVLNLQNNSL